MNFIIGLVEDADTWPKRVRRTYLLTWPISAPLRMLLVLILMALAGAFLLIVDAVNYIRKVWG